MPLKASQGINSDCISAAFRYVPEIPRCSNVYASSRTKACVCARVEYNMFGRRCVSCKSGLSSRVPTAPTHDPTVPQRFHSEVIGTRADRR